MPLPSLVLAPRVEFLTCATGAWWVVEGEQLGSWNQPKFTSNTHHFLTLGTAGVGAGGVAAAARTALRLGRESHIDRPSLAPSPSRPWQGLSLAGLRAACSPPLADSLHLPYFTGPGGWRRTRAGLTSAAARGRERAESPERPAALWAESR